MKRAERSLAKNRARIAAPRRVEICGGIGSGKSTVAGTLAALFHYEPAYEKPEMTPFWSEYYVEKRFNLAFEKNISFILHHALLVSNNQMQKRVCDFSFFEDLAYVRLMPDGQEKDYLESFLGTLLRKHGTPDFLIFVHTTMAERMFRIVERGRPGEADISAEFLLALEQQLEEVVNEHSSLLPVLHVKNSELPLDRFVPHIAQEFRSFVSSTYFTP